MPDNPAHVPTNALIPCAYLCTNTRNSFGLSHQRVNLSLYHKPPWLILLNRLVRSGGASHDWSRVSCVSAQHLTVSCLPAFPTRLWVLVRQGVAAYQTGQAQLLLCCVPMKYVLWGLLLDMLAEPSAVTGRWCVTYLCTVLIATHLDSSLSTFSYLSCSMEYYHYTVYSSPLDKMSMITI